MLSVTAKMASQMLARAFYQTGQVRQEKHQFLIRNFLRDCEARRSAMEQDVDNISLLLDYSIEWSLIACVETIKQEEEGWLLSLTEFLDHGLALCGASAR